MWKTIFNNAFQAIIFRELCDAKGPLANIVPVTKLFYSVHFFHYYQHGWPMEGVTIIESSLATRQGDLLGAPLFVLAQYQVVLETIA